MIFDLGEWRQKLCEIGFIRHDIQIITSEQPPPEGDNFPYNCEIDRWMAEAIIVAEK